MNKPSTENTYSLDELAALVDLPKRTVRYYIQLGLVDGPEGETRAARYGTRQIEQLLEIRKWTAAGISLERIRELLSGEPPPIPPRPRTPGTVEVWSHLVIGEGLELLLEPTRARLSPETVRTFFREVQSFYQQLATKEKP